MLGVWLYVAVCGCVWLCGCVCVCVCVCLCCVPSSGPEVAHDAAVVEGPEAAVNLLRRAFITATQHSATADTVTTADVLAMLQHDSDMQRCVPIAPQPIASHVLCPLPLHPLSS